MRPERPDIAAPPFSPASAWIGDEPAAIERLTAKGPVLVYFFEASEASSYRTLDWVKAWRERYADAGLTTIGVHTPRSGFARDTAELEAVCSRMGIEFPVASDAQRLIWRDYGCKGWPSLFLWRRGGVLAWAHFGEGDYQGTEGAIRAELGTDELPAPVTAERACDEPGAKVIEPSAEVFPGGSHERPLEGGGPPFELDYAAGAAYAAVSGAGRVEVAIDGREVGPLAVEGPAMVRLIEHSRHGDHSLRLDPGAGTRIWSIGFGAGVP